MGPQLEQRAYPMDSMWRLQQRPLCLQRTHNVLDMAPGHQLSISVFFSKNMVWNAGALRPPDPSRLPVTFGAETIFGKCSNKWTSCFCKETVGNSLCLNSRFVISAACTNIIIVIIIPQISSTDGVQTVITVHLGISEVSRCARFPQGSQAFGAFGVFGAFGTHW